MTFVAPSSIQPLQSLVAGEVLTRDHADYERLRRGYNLSIDHYPALILVPKDVNDVVAGVRFAREAGLGVAIQLTGHGLQHPADDNLLIVTSGINAVHVDAAARTARVEAGAVWGQVLEKTAAFGLAPLLGSSPHVGVVGYTLGGGIGWLARKYGLAADSVRWIDVVTADGVLRRASATEHPDLFWALRGGGGNFGVVTAMEFDLYPVKTVYGWNMVYPGECAGEVLRFWREWVKYVPDDLTSSVAIINFPNVPQLPQAVRGKTQVTVRAVYAGESPAVGPALISAWLDWMTPLSNTFREMPFSQIATVSNDPSEPSAVQGSSEMFSTLSDEAINIIVDYVTQSGSPIIGNEIRHAGGQISRLDATSNAIGNRDAQFYMLTGGRIPTADARATFEAYLRQYKAELQPHLHGGVYLNFTSGAEARARVKHAYLPASYERLLAVKAKYDPQNMFRFSYSLVASSEEQA